MLDFSKLLSPETKREINRDSAEATYFASLADLELGSVATYYLSQSSRDGLAPGRGHYDGAMRHIILPELLRRTIERGGAAMCPNCKTEHMGPAYEGAKTCKPVTPRRVARYTLDDICQFRGEDTALADELLGTWCMVKRKGYVEHLHQLTVEDLRDDLVEFVVPVTLPYPEVGV